MRHQGHRPGVVVIQDVNDPEILSDAERFWIAYFRQMGFLLTNLTDGGEGSSGWRASATTRQKMSEVKRMPAESEERVVHMYLSGLSVRAVAKAMGLSQGGVTKALTRRGVERRSISRAQELRHSQRRSQ